MYLIDISINFWVPIGININGLFNLLTLGSGKPSNSHTIFGVGFPLALHFKETVGPGCIVCSINLYNS